MNKISFLVSLICCVAIGMLVSGAGAVMKGLSTAELVGSSEAVIIGEVIDVGSHWSEDGSTIFTNATVDISEVVKGKTLAGRITVEYEGGEVNGIGLRVSDVGTLEKGENVLLFLKTAKSKKNGTFYQIFGRAQGMYKIGRDGIAKKKGFSLIGGEDAVDNHIPLDDLVRKIRSVE